MQIWFGVLDSAVDQPESRQDPRPGIDMAFSVGFAQCGDQQFDRLPDLAAQGGGDVLGSVCAVLSCCSPVSARGNRSCTS